MNKTAAYKTAYTLVVLVMVSILVTGCLYEPPTVSPNKVQVQEDKFFEKMPVAEMDNMTAKGLSNHYRKHGDGNVDITVTYNPKSKNGAMQASNEVARITSLLRTNGLDDVKSSILPVMNSGPDMNVMVSYTSYTALAPKDCTMMAGYHNRHEIDADEEYPLGCSMETLFARQIARPKDLKGQDLDDTVDGRRNANIVERYRTGTPNEALDGESASE